MRLHPPATALGMRLVCLLAMASRLAFGAAAAEPHVDEHAHEEHGDAVAISPEVLAEFGIEVAPVGAGVLHETVLLPGEIAFHGERIARVSSRYPATVQSIEARLGDAITRGQTLAVLEHSETLRPLELKAPIDGTVVEYEITPGAAVGAGETLFTVVDLAVVWADLQIYQRDLARVRAGQGVTIESGHGAPRYRGIIDYVSPVVEEHTRTGLARVVIENRDGQWRPGQFVKGRVTFEEHPVDVFVRRSAILSLEGETVVFVQDDDGFVPRPIELGHGDEEGFEVLHGLEASEVIATRNVISLKAELNRESFGGHHGHVH